MPLSSANGANALLLSGIKLLESLLECLGIALLLLIRLGAGAPIGSLGRVEKGREGGAVQEGRQGQRSSAAKKVGRCQSRGGRGERKIVWNAPTETQIEPLSHLPSAHQHLPTGQIYPEVVLVLPLGGSGGGGETSVGILLLGEGETSRGGRGAEVRFDGLGGEGGGDGTNLRERAGEISYAPPDRTRWQTSPAHAHDHPCRLACPPRTPRAHNRACCITSAAPPCTRRLRRGWAPKSRREWKGGWGSARSIHRRVSRALTQEGRIELTGMIST